MSHVTATQAIYGTLFTLGIAEGSCWLCGGDAYDPVLAKHWIRPTFTDFNVGYGAQDVICAACIWCCEEQSSLLQQMTGKDKPQRMRNYSHFLRDRRWSPYSKGQKIQQLAELLDERGLPEVAVIASSGQKHLLFKARSNPPGQGKGWVQFEEQCIWLDQHEFQNIHVHVDALYNAGHSKQAILTGEYHLTLQHDLAVWHYHETEISPRRGSDLFHLSVYLVGKQEDASG